MRTGVESRSELTFSDLTIARLGANTIFSVNEGTRTIDLGGGAILVRVPKDSGGAQNLDRAGHGFHHRDDDDGRVPQG